MTFFCVEFSTKNFLNSFPMKIFLKLKNMLIGWVLHFLLSCLVLHKILKFEWTKYQNRIFHNNLASLIIFHNYLWQIWNFRGFLKSQKINCNIALKNLFLFNSLLFINFYDKQIFLKCYLTSLFNSLIICAFFARFAQV